MLGPAGPKAEAGRVTGMHGRGSLCRQALRYIDATGPLCGLGSPLKYWLCLLAYMFSEPPLPFYYCSYRVDAEHTDPHGTTISGSATAFVVADNHNRPWIVTNRHVVDRNYRQPTSKYRDFKLSGFRVTGRRPDDTLYTLTFMPDLLVCYHEDDENDVALIEPRVFFDDDGLIGLHWHFGINKLATEADFCETIHPFDLICFTGFPEQRDRLSDRPILRGGRIASDPKFDYTWDLEYKGRCVAYEGFSSKGASGSPVYATARGMNGIDDSRIGKVVGVNAGHLPAPGMGHSGISYFYKSTVVLDIIAAQAPKEA